MKTKDIELQTAYYYETLRGYGSKHGDRFYVLSHDTYRNNPGLHYGPEPKEHYVVHPRGSYLPYRASTGLLAIRVSGYTVLSEADEALLRSVTLNEVLAGHGKLPARLTNGLEGNVRPELMLVQGRFLTEKWDVRQRQIAEGRKAAEKARVEQEQRLEAEKARVVDAIDVLNCVLDDKLREGHLYEAKVELNADQVSQLAAIVKAALPSLFTN